ncbi:hypothetical protein [Kribbella solani]|uniref:Uncharacterized protein n=1 Tax=Kribbella solani TaxID=236067 RepID=A0A841DT09_9ACTN|nr:hypothetical protein [Kribbella solani]MBB5982264.1 hypothetical protein [Kribbella solani]MDX2968502.1 hypothetical protein [Kribbella solani]MDX3003861.1 hypothetical protein [Kribbella solani]
MKRLFLSLLFFLVLALVVGYLVSGPDFMDWGVAGGLFAVAVVGEGFRYWMQRSRARKRESSGV